MSLWHSACVGLQALLMEAQMYTVNRALVTAMLVVSLFNAELVVAATYYVATTGNDGNAGTQQLPWRTVTHAVAMVAAGDTIYVRGGTYTTEGQITIRQSGVTLRNFLGETPIISYPSGSSYNIYVYSGNLSVEIADVTIQGLEIIGAADAGIKMDSARRLVIRGNYIHDNQSQGILGNGA